MKKTDSLRIPDFLEHILEALKRIFYYLEDMDEIVFLKNTLVQDAIVRNLEIIGEAANNLSRYHPEFIIKYSQIPWEDMYWMRNRISHGYFSVDFEIVWKTIERDLPILQKQIQQIYDHLLSSKSRFSKTD